jgi:hypothetical protein
MTQDHFVEIFWINISQTYSFRRAADPVELCRERRPLFCPVLYRTCAHSQSCQLQGDSKDDFIIYIKNAGKIFFGVFSKAHLDWLICFHLSERDFLKKSAILIADRYFFTIFYSLLIILYSFISLIPSPSHNPEPYF